jgi:DNA-binding XRE family transcriptional regulator
MTAKILESNGKPAFAVVPYDEYRALRELAEDADDIAALARFAKRYASGEEQTVPVEVVDRIFAGETPLRVWREYRGMSATRLAASVGITPAHMSKIESGKGDPSLALLRKLGKALNVDLDLLAGGAPPDDGRPKSPSTRKRRRR